MLYKYEDGAPGQVAIRLQRDSDWMQREEKRKERRSRQAQVLGQQHVWASKGTASRLTASTYSRARASLRRLILHGGSSGAEH